MANFLIPTSVLKSAADYTQSTTLDGKEYVLRFRWNQRIGTWFLDISNQDGTSLVSGLALVLGSLLLRYLTDPELPAGEVFLVDRTDAGVQPNIDELGERVRLFFVDSFPV